jgi:phosphate:Na+ symporter
MQASSAAMAATLAALFTGTIDFEQAAYLVVGQNIGTTATALFASIGASVSAKRTAITHLLFNVLTAFIIVIIFPYFLTFSKWVTTLLSGSFDQTLGLAIFHILFSLCGMILFVPFIHQFAKLLMKIVPDRVNTLTRYLDESLVGEPSIAIEVSYKTLRDMLIEVTIAQHILLTNKKVSADYEKKMVDVEGAIEELRKFLNQIQTNSSKERNKLVVILHSLDHVTRLTRVLREQQKIEVIYVQERLMGEWYDLLTEIKDIIHDDENLENITLLLEQKSQKMAEERRARRNQYFERTVANNAELDIVVSKVEALLWIDRLIFHYWRATARMAEIKDLKEK